MTLLCMWQYLKTVEPGAVEGLAVPFAEVVERAVSSVKVKAKRRSEPGLIFWESKQRGSWFADLLQETVVFEKPRSAVAKEIRAAMELTRNLTPVDLDHYTEGRVREIGGAHLMGQLWLIPGPDSVLQSLGTLPGATVATLPVESGEAVGSVLSILASRVQAESERVVGEMGEVQRETNRRRMERLREQAEGISRLAGWIQVDMTAIGEILMEAEGAMKAHLGITRYSKPISFGGESVKQDPLAQPVANPPPVSRSRQITTSSPPPPPALVTAERVDELSVERPTEDLPQQHKRSMRRKR